MQLRTRCRCDGGIHCCSIFSTSRKYSVNRVFSGASLNLISTIVTSLLPVLAPSSCQCLLLHKFWSALPCVLNGSSSVTYLFYPCCYLLKKSPIIIGVYSGIFAIYLQCPSNESRTRTANIVYYIICLLYVFCAATVVCNLLIYILEVSDRFFYKHIIFIISCVDIASRSILLTGNKSHCDCRSHSKCL